MNEVISNLTSIVTTANETSDQNSDNLEVVANLLTQSADVIMTQNASLAVITQVNRIESITCILTDSNY